MYLKFLFNDSAIPKEFGDSLDHCIYYAPQKIAARLAEERQDFLGLFSKINLFVGVNNSGKSRFLRGLLKSENEFFEISESNKSINQLFEELEEWYEENRKEIAAIDKIEGKKTEDLYEDVISSKIEYRNLIGNFNTHLDNFQRILDNQIDDDREIEKLDGPDIHFTKKGKLTILKRRKSIFQSVYSIRQELNFVVENLPSKRVYIPIFRSMARSTVFAGDVFGKAVTELYKLKEDQIFTGLKLFEDILEIRNSRKNKREDFEAFEKFLSTHFFDTKPVEIISNHKENHIILYIDGEERQIHDIGDGIQSIILLMFPIYTASKNTWIFIEEPENNLHSGLQRIFMNTLLNDEFLEEKNLRYFF